MPSIPPTSAQRHGWDRHNAGVVGGFFTTVIFRTRELRLAVSSTTGEMINNEGGLSSLTSLKVRMAKTLFSIAPKAKEMITIAGQSWIIDSVNPDLAWQQEWTLICARS